MQEKQNQAAQKLQKIRLNEKDYYLIDKYFYSPEDIIGQGGFGSVYKGFSMQQHGGKELECAIKKIEFSTDKVLSDKDKEIIVAARKEILVFKRLKHRNIVRLYDAKKMKNVIYLIMELCDEKSLSSYIRQQKDITENEICYLFSQILEGFQYLRKMDIIHRDLKPENILMKNGQLKIADFGLATIQKPQTYMQSIKGTIAIMAPQIMEGVHYSSKCDIWSLGATLYYMCFKVYPYKEFYQSHVKVIQLMKRDCIDFPTKGLQISEQLKQMIISMLRYNESDRIEWEQLFKSPLFSQKRLKEIEGLNVFDYIDEADEGNHELEVSQIEEFDFQLNDKTEQELEQLEKFAVDQIDQAQIQRRNREILQKLLKRITFEKGKARLLRIYAEKVHEYELLISSKLVFEKTKVNISDHLKALRCGLNKYELFILRGLLEWLKINKQLDFYKCQDINKNPLGVNEDDWERFLEQDEVRKIEKTLEKELNISQNYVYNASRTALKQIQSINKQAFDQLQVNDEYMNDDLRINKQFFITLYNLCIGLSKLLFPELVKIKNKQDQLHKVLNTLVLIDDLFIVMNLDYVFPYSEDTPVNFNAVFQSRKTNFSEDQDMYKKMFQRVLRTYEVFFD